MALEITEQVEIAFQDADKADQRLDEFLVRDRMVRILHDLGEFTQEQRRGNFALISALEFQPRRMYGEPIWDMYWQPLSSATDTFGKDHFFPDVIRVASRNFLTICLTRFITFWVAFRVTTHVFG
jgi:hypothetical protein